MLRAAWEGIRSNRLWKNAAWHFSGGTVATGLELLLGIVLARSLGASTYGAFALIVASGNFFSLVMDFRTWEVAPALLGQFEERYGRPQALLLIRRLVALDILVGVVTCAALLALSRPIAVVLLGSPGASPLVRIYSLSALFNSFTRGTAIGALRFYGAFRGLAAKSVAVRSVGLGVIGVAAVLGDLGIVLWANALVALFDVLLTASMLWRLWQTVAPAKAAGAQPSSPPEWRPVLKALFQGWVSGSLKSGQSRVEVLILGLLGTKTEAGLYRAGSDIANLVDRIGNPIQTSALQELARYAAAKDRARFLSTCRQALVVGSLLMAPIALGATLWNRELVLLMLGPSYLGTAPVLVILIWSVGINNALIWLRPAMVALNQLDVANGIGLVTMVVLVGSAVWLIPRYGGVGAAIAFALRQLSASGLYLAGYLRAVHRFPR